MEVEVNLLAKRYKLMARRIARTIAPDEVGFTRASGHVVCQTCGLTLYDHPPVADGQLVIACDGRQYKL